MLCFCVTCARDSAAVPATKNGDGACCNRSVCMWSPCNKKTKQPAIGYSSCGPAILKMAYFTLVWQSKSSLQGDFSCNLQHFRCQQGLELNGLLAHNTKSPYAALKSDMGCDHISSSEPLILVKQKGKKTRFNLLASPCLWVLDVICHSPAQKAETQTRKSS